MRSYVQQALVTLCFIYSLRPSTLSLPGLDTTLTQLQDRWWESLEQRPERSARAFDERFGSPVENYFKVGSQAAADIASGDFAVHMSTPFLGEPLEIANIVRRFPEIHRLSLSAQVAAQGELYQRLFEGLYPVLVAEDLDEHYRLVTAAEVGSCQVLGVAKEAHLVRCP